MKEIALSHSNNLTKLHDELLAAIPALRPVADKDGRLVAVFGLSGNGSTLTLDIPDDADVAAITAVVNAHDPTPPVPKPTAKQTVDAALSLVDVTKTAIALAALKTIVSTLAGKVDR